MIRVIDMRPIILLGLIISSLSLFGQRNPVIQQFQAERVYAQGLSFYEQGAYREAISRFDRVVDLHEDHEGVYEFRAEAYYQLGNYRAAVHDYERALRQDPNNVELLNSAGVAAGQLAMYSAAVAYFDRALKLNPSHPQARHNRAEALRRQGQATAMNQPDGRQPKDPFATSWSEEPREVAPSILDLRAFSLTRSDESISPLGTPREKTFASQTPQEERFAKRDIRVGGQSDPEVNIDRVVIRKNETEVSLRITNVSDGSFPLRLAGKREDRAFFLTNQGFDRIYELRDVRNFDNWDRSAVKNIPPGKTEYVVLVFRRLDDDVRTFHLLEGDQPFPGAWSFWQVQLK